MLGRIWKRLFWQYQCRGLRGTLAASLAHLTGQTNSAWYWNYTENQFDRYNQVDTRGIVPIDELETHGRDKSQWWGYYPTEPERLARLIDDHTNSDTLPDTTFIDFGSGKGRALLVASLFPFKEVIGVEFSSELHQSAVNNTSTFRSGKPNSIRPICADATTFELPDSHLVVYFFNPFQACILSQVIERMEQSLAANRRQITVIYQRPLHHELFDASPRWQSVHFEQGPDEPRCAVYRAIPQVASPVAPAPTPQTALV